MPNVPFVGGIACYFYVSCLNLQAKLAIKELKFWLYF